MACRNDLASLLTGHLGEKLIGLALTENFQVGVEMYGGLGTHADFGLRETSHYVAPTVAWTLASGTMFKVSPGFGVTGTSAGVLLRFGVSYEFAQFGRRRR